MLERYEAQKARIDRIAESLFSQCCVLYGNGLKPESIDGIHVSDSSWTKRICLLQGPFSVAGLESLPDEHLADALRRSAVVHGYYASHS